MPARKRPSNRQFSQHGTPGFRAAKQRTPEKVSPVRDVKKVNMREQKTPSEAMLELVTRHKKDAKELKAIYLFAGHIYTLAAFKLKGTSRELLEVTSEDETKAKILADIKDADFPKEYQAFYNWAQEKLNESSSQCHKAVSDEAWKIKKAAAKHQNQLR